MNKEQILAALKSAEEYAAQQELETDKVSAAYYHLRQSLLAYVNSPDYD